MQAYPKFLFIFIDLCSCIVCGAGLLRRPAIWLMEHPCWKYKPKISVTCSDMSSKHMAVRYWQWQRMKDSNGGVKVKFFFKYIKDGVPSTSHLWYKVKLVSACRPCTTAMLLHIKYSCIVSYIRVHPRMSNVMHMHKLDILGWTCGSAKCRSVLMIWSISTY